MVWPGRTKTPNFCNPSQSWPSLPALMGLRNSDVNFSEILIRDGQTRGKKIRNPFALVVGLNKVQPTFLLPPRYFPLQCRLCSSRFQQDWDAELLEGAGAAAVGFPNNSNLILGVCGTWSSPDVLLALQTAQICVLSILQRSGCCSGWQIFIPPFSGGARKGWS